MTTDAGKQGQSGQRSRRKRYDKDLVRDRTLEVLAVRLGPPKDQGARAVWDCPACGKREKYSVVKANGKGGCLVADCRLAGSGDVFVMLAALEGLDYRADFLTILGRSYELLGLEPADRQPRPRANSESPATPGVSGQGAAPKAVPVGRRPLPSPERTEKDPRSSSGGTPTIADLEQHLELAARAYERILELCPLETRDRRYLKSRGLSNATIKRGRFGTMTAPRAS